MYPDLPKPRACNRQPCAANVDVSGTGVAGIVLAVLACILLVACAGHPEVTTAPDHARNVILFLGDGMGITSITAARIFDGQSRGESGEENQLVFERFPQVALVKTYNTDQQVPDSAGTATAIHTGVKSRAGVIDVGPEAHRRDCSAARQHVLESFGERAKKAGKGVGVVSTARVTHATPATVYAHIPERDWESDHYLPAEAQSAGCVDIARQLVDFDTGGGLDIVLGGGRQEFLGSSLGGERQNAGENLLDEWERRAGNRQVISTRAELSSIGQDEQVVGLFSMSHMTYVAERSPETTEPTLAEMTIAAIRRLSANEKGYYLLVEGGRIDHGHHDGLPGYAMLETQEFARAITAALGLVDLDETLVLVTADHSHALTLSGYPTRGNPILGLVVENDLTGEPEPAPKVSPDGQPYATLSYANGPGAVRGPRPAPETGITALAQALVPTVDLDIDGTLEESETHGGEDVALYAVGVGAECVSGVLEQNLVYAIMAHAFGWQELTCPPDYRRLR